MPRIHLITFFLLTASAFLAGCLGGDEAPTQGTETETPEVSEEPAVTETTGAIQGTARNLDYMPLAGARITLLDTARGLTGIETLVARDGTWTLNNLEPGQYRVHISALGYDAKQRPATVTAGEIAKIEFVLEELDLGGPWVDEQEWVGKVAFAVAWQIEPPGVGCIIQPVHTQTVKTCSGIRFQGPTDNGEVAVEPSESAKTLMIALVWSPAGPLGETLQFDFMCKDVPRDGDQGAVLDTEHPCYFLHERKTSPIEHRIDEAHWLENGYNFTAEWRARVFATYGLLGTHGLTGIDVGVAYEQAFSIYSAVFHEDPAPEGYTVIPDA